MQVVPKISRVGVLWDANNPERLMVLKSMRLRARTKIQLQSLGVRGRTRFGGSISSAAKGRVNALVTINTPVLNRQQKRSWTLP